MRGIEHDYDRDAAVRGRRYRNVGSDRGRRSGDVRAVAGPRHVRIASRVTVVVERGVAHEREPAVVALAGDTGVLVRSRDVALDPGLGMVLRSAVVVRLVHDTCAGVRVPGGTCGEATKCRGK